MKTKANAESCQSNLHINKNPEIDMKKLLRLLDFVFVLRPTMFFSVWTIFLSGFFVQSKFGVAATQVTTDDALVTGQHDFLWVGLFLTLLIGALFIVNQLKDQATANRGSRVLLIGQGLITPRAAYVEALILIVPAIIFGFLFSINMGILFVEILLLIGILYNFKPFSWKDKALLSLVSNVLFAFLLFSGGWIIEGSLTKEVFVHALPYVCAAAAVYLFTTLPSTEEDAAPNRMTFGLRYGFKQTVYLGCVLDVVAIVSAYYLGDEIIFYPAFFSLPFFIWAIVKQRTDDVYRAITFPIFLLSMTICFKYKMEIGSLVYFFLVFGLYFLSKAYYKFRHGIDYPRLSF